MRSGMRFGNSWNGYSWDVYHYRNVAGECLTACVGHSSGSALRIVKGEAFPDASYDDARQY